MKKILSFVLISLLMFSNITFVNASETESRSTYIKSIIVTRNTLRKDISWDKYIRQIDTVIYKLAKKESSLLKLSEKIQRAKSNLQKKPASSKKARISNILDYLEAKVDLAILDLWLIEYNDELDEEEYDDYEEDTDIDTFYKNTISDSERKKVETEIVKIQKNLFEKWVTNLKAITDEFDKLTNYEEKWNFSVNVDVNHSDIWTYNWELKLSDYIIKNSNFDSQINWKISTVIDALPQWQEQIKLELSWLIDYIQKDGNMYLLLENLNIKKKNIDDIKEFVETLEKIAEEKKYIKFEDKNTQEWYKIMKSFSPSNLISDWRDIVWEPMFKAYKKLWNRYYIMPTKYACDSMKELANKFDPFNWKECSESQYNSILEDFAEGWNIYMEIWDFETKLWFDWYKIVKKEKDLEKLNMEIIFNNNNIKDLSIQVIPNQVRYPNNWIVLKYKRNTSLKWYVYFSERDSEIVDLSLDSKLDNNNRFTYINYEWEIVDGSDKLVSFLKLENNKINWSVELNENNTQPLDLKISWETNVNNIVSKLNLNLEWNDLDWVDKIDAEFSYNNDNFSLLLDVKDSRDILDLDLNWNRDSHNKVLKSFDGKVVYKTKSRRYDYNTWKYIDATSFSEVFNSKLKLQNTLISWATSINQESWENIITISHSWNYEKDYLVLNNSFVLWDDIANDMADWDASVRWNLNLKADVRNNKDNVNIYFDLMIDQDDLDLGGLDLGEIWGNQSIKVEIDNKSTIQYKNININTPTNTISSDEIFNNYDVEVYDVEIK